MVDEDWDVTKKKANKTRRSHPLKKKKERFAGNEIPYVKKKRGMSSYRRILCLAETENIPDPLWAFFFVFAQINRGTDSVWERRYGAHALFVNARKKGEIKKKERGGFQSKNEKRKPPKQATTCCCSLVPPRNISLLFFLFVPRISLKKERRTNMLDSVSNVKRKKKQWWFSNAA